MFVEEEIVAEAGSKRANLVKHFEGTRKVALERIEKFSKEMLENPFRAMEWADSVFEATAIKEVADAVLYMLKHYTTLLDVHELLYQMMRDKARYINNKSTSVCGNHLKESMLSQTTLAMEHVEHFI